MGLFKDQPYHPGGTHCPGRLHAVPEVGPASSGTKFLGDLSMFYVLLKEDTLSYVIWLSWSRLWYGSEDGKTLDSWALVRGVLGLGLHLINSCCFEGESWASVFILSIRVVLKGVFISSIRIVLWCGILFVVHEHNHNLSWIMFFQTILTQFRSGLRAPPLPQAGSQNVNPWPWVFTASKRSPIHFAALGGSVKACQLLLVGISIK